jgi:hypothetical protein
MAYYREEVADQIASAELRNVTLAQAFANAVGSTARSP